jgi:acid phosphatase type 7
VKKPFFFITPLLGAITVSAFLAWAFSLHGTIGLFRVNGVFHWGFILTGLIGLGMLAFSGLYLWTGSTKTRRLPNRLNVSIAVISLVSVLGASTAFVTTGDVLAAGIGDTPPQLLITDGTGIFGTPNIALTFNTSIPTKNTLEWGLAETGKLTTAQESLAATGHAFMLRDLVPDRRYLYRINGGPPFYFTTVAAGGTVHFAVGSDAHFGSATASRLASDAMLSQIAEPSNGYDMFFFLGDLVEYGFSRSQWRDAFDSMATASATVPTRYLPGNHDTLFAGSQNYQDYCYPSGMDLRSGSRFWYRIDVGTIHFLCLDVEWSAESVTEAQLTWLGAQLRDIPENDWKIVMCHGFFYASGSVTEGWQWYDNQETISKLGPIFEQYHVDLVFSGHDHQLETLQHQGVTYVVCGSFGGLPDQPRTYTSPASTWYANGLHAFADITINGSDCTVTIRDQDAEVLRTLAITKH